MLTVIATAAQGMAIQSRRIEAAAHAIASTGLGPAAAGGQEPGAPPVRVGSLPVGDLAANVVTLVEAKQAYLANVAVIAVASDMLDALLDIVHPDRK